MAKSGPYYEFARLKTACKFAMNGENTVDIKTKVLEDAKAVFGIDNKNELFSVVINLNIKELRYLKTRDLEKTSEFPPPKVDSYMFVYKFIDGYLAFYLSEYTGIWVIKSFKKYDDDYSKKETDLGRQLRELGLI